MKAAQIIAPGQVEIIEAEMPALADGQVLVRMQTAAICGSDLRLFRLEFPNYPLAAGYPGHECVGTVEISRADGFVPGDRVLALPPQRNGFAEYVAVEPQYLVPLPPAVELERMVLAQQLGTALYLLQRLDSPVNKRVVILGQGPAGLLFTALFSQMGAAMVVGIDLVAHRLKIAREMGATHIVDASLDSPQEIISELTEGTMADLVVEAVGKEETINQAIELAREGGELAYFGIAKKSPLTFEYEKFFRKQLRTTSSWPGQKAEALPLFRRAVEMIARNKIVVAPLVSHCLPLEEIARGFWLAETKAEGAVKVLINL